MDIIKHIHERAVSAAKQFKTSEAALLEVLIEVETNRVFEKMGFPSMHVYCVEALNLTDAQAYNFIGVARKAKEVPELKERVCDGSIHLTNARRIAPVLTQQNKIELLEKAKDLSYRELERELIKSHPEKLTQERIRPVTETRLEMKVFITPEIEKNLKRMQNVLSQKLRKPYSLEEVLAFMAQDCLERHDPVKRAQRSRKTKLVARRATTSRSIPAPVAHQVVNRDQGQCAFILPNGKRCTSQRWLQRHHVTPWSHGGGHTVENLATLCATHHRHIHDSGLPRAKMTPFRVGPMAR